MDFNIPTEVKDKSAFPQIKKLDRQIIAAAVLMRLSNQEAFRLFHPEYADMRGGLNDAGKKDSKHFWGYGKTKDYREQYEKELAEFLGRKSAPKSEIAGEIDESRKDKALKSLLNQAMSLVEGSGDLDAETLKIAAEIFKKVGLLKDEVEQQEAPRRYLPCRCLSECQYRLFCEKAIENGEIENECLYCKALAIAQEHGYKYDPTTNLSIPQKDV